MFAQNNMNSDNLEEDDPLRDTSLQAAISLFMTT
jgi:hypothetical protein